MRLTREEFQTICDGLRGYIKLTRKDEDNELATRVHMVLTYLERVGKQEIREKDKSLGAPPCHVPTGV